jgi:Mg2+ and Co2+ transporter CorA
LDLHLNVKSFQMNQFMRFLAVVSFLGLIPSIAGGLLGMNVEGSPWSITLPQVAFIVSLAIAFSLYLFAVRGWLR